MKSLGLLTALSLSAAFALSGCVDSSAPAFTLTGTGLSADLNGKYLYFLENSRQPFDSVLVQDGAFTYTMDSVSTERIISITDMKVGGTVFVPEAGKAELRTSDGTLTDAYVFSIEPENGLNTQLYEFNTRKTAVEKPILDRLEIWNEQYKLRDSLPEAKMAELTAEKALIDSIYSAEMGRFYEKEFAQNKDNIIGGIIFPNLGFEDEKDFMTQYEAASSAVQNYPFNKSTYELYKKSGLTAVGADFTDVTMTDDKGNQQKISDLWRPDTYLLIDFWASWCGPCRKAMPHLAELHQKLGDKLTVLSIGGLQETPEQNAKAREELNMTWTTFFDANSDAANVYGVTAIPNLVLVGPDSKILVRTNDPDEIDAKLKEVGLL